MSNKSIEIQGQNKANQLNETLNDPVIEILADIAFIAGQLFTEGKIDFEDSREMILDLKELAVEFSLGFDAANEKRDYLWELEAYAGNKLLERYGLETYHTGAVTEIISGYRVSVGGTRFEIGKEDGSGITYAGSCAPGTTPRQIYNHYYAEDATADGGMKPPSSLLPGDYRTFMAAIYVSFYAGREQCDLASASKRDFEKAVIRCAEEYANSGSRISTQAFRQGALEVVQKHLPRFLLEASGSGDQ